MLPVNTQKISATTIQEAPAPNAVGRDSIAIAAPALASSLPPPSPESARLAAALDPGQLSPTAKNHLAKLDAHRATLAGGASYIQGRAMLDEQMTITLECKAKAERFLSKTLEKLNKLEADIADAETQDYAALREMGLPEDVIQQHKSLLIKAARLLEKRERPSLEALIADFRSDIAASDAHIVSIQNARELLETTLQKETQAIFDSFR